MRRRIVCGLIAAVSAAVAASAAGCTRDASLDRVLARGELLVATRNGPTTWYEGPQGPEGPEYEMARAFAASLGVRLRIVPADSVEDLFRLIEQGRADVAAAGITRLPSREARFLFGPDYAEVTQQLVCRRRGRIVPVPRNLEALEQALAEQGEEVVVAAGTSYAQRLAELARTHPRLRWRVDPEASTLDLLRLVWARRVACTVADSTIVDAVRRFMPELVPAFALTPPQPLAWMLPKTSQALRDRLSAWFQAFRRSGGLDRVRERYFGHLDQFDYVDTRRFLRAMRERLPPLRRWFEEAAQATGFRWTLLAAQAWVESHWRPDATSRTGVRGIMMLTERTARELGVTDRLDPRQSILGGARYLRRLHRRLPATIPEPDRTWMALAAYTIGYGHVADLRRKIAADGGNPNRWSDLAAALPLLMSPKVYRRLPHGYGHGVAALRYVRKIRYYQELIEQRLGQLRSVRVRSIGAPGRAQPGADPLASGRG